jgi:hypothetical protein
MFKRGFVFGGHVLHIWELVYEELCKAVRSGLEPYDQEGRLLNSAFKATRGSQLVIGSDNRRGLAIE